VRFCGRLIRKRPLSVTGVLTGIEKDQRVTDNGDGTLTILVLTTGNAVLYGENGKAIARDPGQVRFEILVDDGGTPSDPSDDEFLANLGLVKARPGGATTSAKPPCPH
jgi:hypothetical protein